MKIRILLFLMLTFSLFADDAAIVSYMDSGSAFLITNETIVMEEELVEYKDGKFYTTFFFKNDNAEEQSVQIGFPVYGEASEIGRTRMPGWRGLDITVDEEMQKIESYYNFQSFCNDEELPRELIPSKGNEEYAYYFAATIHFEPFERIKVENTFNYKPYIFEDSILNRSYTVNYILKSGATWKDSIGKAVVRFYIQEKAESYFFFDTLFSGRFRKFEIDSEPRPTEVHTTDGYIVYEWQYDNLEPDFDIELNYRYGDWGTYDEPFDAGAISGFMINLIFSEYFESGDLTVLDSNASFFSSLDDPEFINDIYLPALYDYIVDGNNALNKDEEQLFIRFAINMLYALNDYSFSTDLMQKLFSQFSWYEGTTTNPTFSDKQKYLLEKFMDLRDSL